MLTKRDRGRVSWRLLASVLPVLLVVQTVGASVVHTPTAVAVPRPNVVMLMIDDLTVEQYLQFMPQTRARLEPSGTSYTNSVVSYSECCPSRATFLTGQYAHNHGVMSGYPPSGGYDKLDHSNTLPVWLHDAGYYTAQIGKYLNGYGELNPPNRPPGWDEWFTLVDPSTQFFYDYTIDDNGTLTRYGTSAADYRETVLTNKALQVIDAAATRGQPFFLNFNPPAPHIGYLNSAAYDFVPLEGGPLSPRVGYYPPPSTAGALNGYAIPHGPDFNEADVADKPSFAQLPAMGTTEVTNVETSYRRSSELVLALDTYLSSIIDELDATGLLSNTIVMLTSDNGYFFGEHRVKAGKFLPYEPSVKVPLVVRGPGFVAGAIENRPVANVDLAPSIVAATGATAARVMDGRPLQDLVVDPALGNSRPILLETGPLWGRRYYRGVRTTQYKYIEYSTGERELYDLIADPYELQNLAGSASVTVTQASLRNLLLGMRRCVGATCLAPLATPTGQALPVADAGADSEVAPSQAIYLLGQDSFDPDGGPLTYRWSVVTSPTGGTIGSTQPNAVSSAPASFQTLVYRLTVTDSTGLSASDDVSVRVGFPYHAPIANAGADQIVQSGANAQLSGSGSTESPSESLVYQWMQLSGPAVTLQGATTQTPTFTAPTSAAQLTFQLTVTDKKRRKGSDKVIINASGLSAPMPMSVTAASLSTVVGQTSPTIGCARSGAVTGVPVSSFTGSTTALPTSAPGTYATTCSGPASDANYAYTYITGVHTVRKAATAISLMTTPNPAVLGQAVALVATVTVLAPGSGIPGATVVVSDGTTPIYSGRPAAGKLTFSTNALALGSHSLTASILAGGLFLGSTSAAVTLIVGKPTVTITADSVSIVFGQPVPSIGYRASGTLAGTPITAPTCASPASTAVGTYATTCVGPAEDAWYRYTYVGGVLSIAKASTLLSLTATSAAPTAGQPVTFTVTAAAVAPGSGTPGSIATIWDGTPGAGGVALVTANLVGGRVTFTTTTLGVGTHNLRATYLGGGNFKPSTSAVISVSVSPLT